jgi:hypothetical protein
MEPGELNVDTRYGTLTINGYSLFQPHVTISDPVALLDLAELRGADRLVPHAVGTLARRRRRTVTRKDFPIAMTGWCDLAGVKVAASQRHMQLITNRETVAAALGIGEDAPAGVAGTVTAVWTRPDGSTKSGPVHVLTPWRLELHGFVVTGVLSLSIPAGRLT